MLTYTCVSKRVIETPLAVATALRQSIDFPRDRQPNDLHIQPQVHSPHTSLHWRVFRANNPLLRDHGRPPDVRPARDQPRKLLRSSRDSDPSFTVAQEGDPLPSTSQGDTAPECKSRRTKAGGPQTGWTKDTRAIACSGFTQPTPHEDIFCGDCSRFGDIDVHRAVHVLEVHAAKVSRWRRVPCGNRMPFDLAATVKVEACWPIGRVLILRKPLFLKDRSQDD